MLENFTNEEIEYELLETGYLYLTVPGEDTEMIEKQAVEHPRTGQYIGSIYKRSYTTKGSGERSVPFYRKFSALFFCEHITFDDIRKSWSYHGVLLGSPDFCEKIVHNTGCACMKC